MFIDTHVHLSDEAFALDLQEVLYRAKDAGISKMIVIAYDLPSSYKVLELAEAYENLYCTVGVHPCDASTYDAQCEYSLRQLLKKGKRKIVAVGEIGLDYHYDNVERINQKEVFIRQWRLASEFNLPIVIHDRDAHQDCLEVVKQAAAEKIILPEAGVFHCYSAGPDLANILLKYGFYFGFDGPLTYKNAVQPPASCTAIPLERLLLETDCPYLPPVPYRGKRNEPSYLIEVAKKMADLKGISLKELSAITSANTARLFKKINLD